VTSSRRPDHNNLLVLWVGNRRDRAMAYDEGLATRVREVLGDQPGVAEQRMFGGLAFLVHGNMACGMRGEDLIVRLAADAAESVQGEPGVRPFDLTGR
jgi:hypothetical protein